MNTTHLNKSRPKAATRIATLLLAISAALLPASTQAAETEPSAKALEALTKAFAAQDAKDWAGAKALSDKQPAVVRDLVQWRYVSSQDSGASFDEIDVFLGAHGNWPGRFQIVQRGEEALLTNALIDTKGSAWFKARQPRTSGGCLAWAKFQYAREQKQEALSGIRRCWLAFTLNLADYQDWTTATQMTLPEGDHLARADAALWNKNVSGARELLPLLSAKPQAVADARIRLQSGNAFDIDDIVEDAPSPAWAASLIYDQAVQQRKAGKTQEAWSLLMKADDNGALPPAYSQTWWLEHNLQARNALDAGEHNTAYKLASRTRLSADNNVAAYLDAEFLAGWIALRNIDEPKKALVHFQNLEAAAKSPITHARADYWKALALKARDDDAKARKALADAAASPATFYGRLALEMLKDAPPRAPSATPPPSSTSSGEDIEELVQASAALLRIGDNRRANAFANAAIDGCQSAACATTLSTRLSQLGNNYGAVRSAKKAQTLGVSRQDQLYPLIDLPAACTTAGVPPALILALIRQESEFDPTAVSSADARGLLQILPSTAKDVARRNAIAYAGAADLFKPEINLAIGCYHVKELLDGLGGSWVLTIAGYNAGKARVLGWTTAHGDPRDPNVGVIDWIEAIPFDETRNYVMRVIENELAYKTRRNEALQPQELNQILRPAPSTAGAAN